MKRLALVALIALAGCKVDADIRSHPRVDTVYAQRAPTPDIYEDTTNRVACYSYSGYYGRNISCVYMPR